MEQAFGFDVETEQVQIQQLGGQVFELVDRKEEHQQIRDSART